MGLKIGLVTGEYPPMEGGVGAFTQEIAKALAALGHEIHIITSNKARPSKERTRPQNGSFSETYKWLDNLNEPYDLGYAKLHPRGRRWRWSEVTLIADIVQRYELDVVNVQYQAAAYNMRSAAINLLPWRLQGLVHSVITYHDLRVPYLFPKAGRFREKSVYFMGQQADGVIVTNQSDYEVLTQQIDTPIRAIPIGSNISTYVPNQVELDEVRESLRLKKDDYLLGYFGFLNESKGADTLIKSLAELDKRHHLVFIGGRTGASDHRNNKLFFDNLDHLIRAFGLEERVHWTGFVSDVRVSSHLHAADLVVMPYKDGVSLRRGTLMAALAHGRPVISTEPAQPIPELTHGENIWLVPPDDPKQLTRQVKKLLKDQSLREQLGHGACEVAQQFTWDKIAEQTAAFFEELVSKRAEKTNGRS